jgi:hypothetical protein
MTISATLVELGDQVVIDGVEQVVVLDHRFRFGRVALHERIQRRPHLPLAEIRQLGQVVDRLERRALVQVDGALGHVHGQVPDPLQVDDDLQGRGDEAQVARRRLAEDQKAAAGLVDLQLEAVDLTVLADHRLGELGVPLGQRAHAVCDLGLHLPAQGQQLVAEIVELRVVRLVGMRLHPNLPVT